MEPELGPVVIISGVTVTEKAVCYELKRRGFIVKHSMVQSGICSAAVTLSKKLVAKLSAENNLPVQPLSSHTPASKLVLANSACGVILRSNAIGAKAAWVAHDQHRDILMDAVAKSSVSDPGKELLQINSYFGSQVALYYGFLSFYTKNLIPATIGGGLLFLYQLANQHIDSAWLPVFCLSITVWSTLYLEQWKRRCSELAYAWGVYGSEDMELTVELAKVITVASFLINHLQQFPRVAGVTYSVFSLFYGNFSHNALLLVRTFRRVQARRRAAWKCGARCPPSACCRSSSCRCC
jgi:hypothetical protein